MTTVEPRAAQPMELIVRQLAGLGGQEVTGGGATRGAATVRLPPETLEAATHALAVTEGVRLADMFADNGGDVSTLRLVWSCGPGYLVTETEIGSEEYPPLSDVAPAAFVEECEIYEQFGIRPATGKPLNRLMLPPHAGPDFPRLGHRPARPLDEAHARHTVGGQAFEFPFGPVRQVGVESLYYGLVTSGEEVVDLYLLGWHKHRGVEWRLRGTTPHEAAFLAERVEGLSAVALGWAFAAATEAALDVAPPAAAARTRAVALELERLYNHAAATAALCQSTGLTVGQSAAEIALEQLLRVNAAAFGHRYLFGVVDTRRSQPRSGRRRAPPRPARRLRRAAPVRRRAAGHELLRRPAGGHRHPHRRAGASPRPGRPGRARHRTDHRHPRRRGGRSLRPAPGHRRHRGRRRRARPLPGDARRGSGIRATHRRVPGRWHRGGPR